MLTKYIPYGDNCTSDVDQPSFYLTDKNYDIINIDVYHAEKIECDVTYRIFAIGSKADVKEIATVTVASGNVGSTVKDVSDSSIDFSNSPIRVNANYNIFITQENDMPAGQKSTPLLTITLQLKPVV